MLPKDDIDLLWKCQAYVKRGQEFTDDQISELERMFNLGLKSGFEPFNKYSRKLFHTGAWRSLLGLYVLYQRNFLFYWNFLIFENWYHNFQLTEIITDNHILLSDSKIW